MKTPEAEGPFQPGSPDGAGVNAVGALCLFWRSDLMQSLGQR